MNHLLPCPECQRHVRAREARCPFCDAALDLAKIPAPVLPTRRLSRAALFAFGATIIGATAMGCSDSDEDTGTGGTGGTSGTAGTGGSGGGTGGSAGSATGGTAGATTGGSAGMAGAPIDDGGGQALYGAAP